MKKCILLFILLVSSIVDIFAQGDLCSSASTLTINSTCSNSTANIVAANTSSGTTPNCFANNKDIWYKFTGTGGNITVKYTPAAGYDAEMITYTGSCGSLTAYDCADGTGSGSSETTIIENSNASTTYYVRVMRVGGGTMNGSICAWGGTNTSANSCFTPPTVDIINNVVYSTSLNTPTGQASYDPGTSKFTCNGSIDNLTYYKISTSSAGGTVTMSIDELSCWFNEGIQVGLFLPTTACSSSSAWNNAVFCNVVAANTTTTINWTGLQANKIYYLIIDGYAGDLCSWRLSFTGALPVELSRFDGIKYKYGNLILWETLSEVNNDYFTLERSIDAENFIEIGRVIGAGNSTTTLKYYFLDKNINGKSYYYRLKQTDYDGRFKYSDLIFINRNIDDYMSPKKILKIYNYIGQEVDENYQGVKFILYEDGSSEKVY